MKLFYATKFTYNLQLRVCLFLLLTYLSSNLALGQTCDDPGGGHRFIDLANATGATPTQYFPGVVSAPAVGRSTAGYIEFKESSAAPYTNRTIVINPVLNGTPGSVILKYDILTMPAPNAILSIYEGTSVSGPLLRTLNPGNVSGYLNTREQFNGPITIQFSSPTIGTPGGPNFEVVIQYQTGDQVRQSCFDKPFAVWTDFMPAKGYTFVDDYGDPYGGNSAPICIGYFDENRQFVSTELGLCIDHEKYVASIAHWYYPGQIVFTEGPNNEYHFVEEGEASSDYNEDDKLKAARVMWLLANAPTSSQQEKLDLQLAIWWTTMYPVDATHAQLLATQAQLAVPSIPDPAEPVFSITTNTDTVEPDETIEFTINFDFPGSVSPTTHPSQLKLNIPSTLQVISSTVNGVFDELHQTVVFNSLPGTLTLTVKSVGEEARSASIQAIYDEENFWNITNLLIYKSCDPEVQNFVGLSKNNINHPYREAVGTWETSLPVTLTHFTLTQENNLVQLNWATATEEGSKGFEVQRSEDTRNWTKLDYVESKSFNGDSQANLDYSFIDHTPVDGKNYYRLKQIDLDGTYAYSQIRSAVIESIQINTYPNPVATSLTLDGLKGGESIKIYNSTGRLLLEENHSNQEAKKSILMNSFADGIYIVKVTDTTGKVQTRKVLKTK